MLVDAYMFSKQLFGCSIRTSPLLQTIYALGKDHKDLKLTLVDYDNKTEWSPCGMAGPELLNSVYTSEMIAVCSDHWLKQAVYVLCWTHFQNEFSIMRISETSCHDSTQVYKFCDSDIIEMIL